MKRECAKSEYLLAARKLRSSEVTRSLYRVIKKNSSKTQKGSTHAKRAKEPGCDFEGNRYEDEARMREIRIPVSGTEAAEQRSDAKLIQSNKKELFENAERLDAREARERAWMRFRRQQV